MLDAFTITFLLILLSALLAAIIRRVRRDKCLRDFAGDMITLEKVSGKVPAKGAMELRSTGMEFVYPEKEIDEDECHMSSYIFFKYEYPQIQALVRYHNDLTAERQKKRLKQFNRLYHPSRFRKLGRKIRSLGNIVQDSIREVIDLVINYAQKSKHTGSVLATKNTYVMRMKDDLIESVGMAHEPLLEKYIGHKVVLELIKGEQKLRFSGVLKDYTKSFIELWNLDYRTDINEEFRKADIIVPQNLGIIRHYGE